MSTVITVENLGKKYTISHQQREEYSSLRDVITNSVASLGKKLIHPFRSSLAPCPLPHNPASEDFLALKDVSFEVKQGDRIGIIGRNGAGKSTLLKILSRITEPTTGSVRIKGRVASLLEVGTGFHPELTGRENVYLNGAILGMQREEIRQKFDEIVAFAEIEKFLDTPVKRYSSGMYVRLAFAVAAHLEPEILIVDEVLAVGDAQFQKKCLGKIEDVSAKEGRTVLFVSHNMGAILQICNKCILLDKGITAFNGDVRNAVTLYSKASQCGYEINSSNFIGPLRSKIEFSEVRIYGSKVEGGEISPSVEISIVVKGNCLEYIPRFRTSVAIYKEGYRLCTLHDLTAPEPLFPGNIVSEVKIPPFFLRPGDYYIAVGGHDGGTLAPGTDWIFGNEVASFTIIEEWSERNDFANVGVVNLLHKGLRRTE